MFIIGHLRGERTRPVFPIFGENAEVSIQIIGNADPRRKIGSRTLVYDKIGLMGTLCASDYKEPKLIQVGSLEGKFQSSNRIYSPESLAPTLNTMQDGGREPKVMVIDDQGRRNKKISPKNIVPTLRAQSHGNEPKIAIKEGTKKGYALGLKIRKLTPREYWRLQAFPDWAFDKAQEVNSKTQLYKQAGNSVTVNVIKAIAERLK